MVKKILISKAEGESELFSAEKLRQSLLLTGASKKMIDNVIVRVKKQIHSGDTSGKIYTLAFNLLKQENKTYAARYGLKKALMQLGPDGFPFEKYVAALFTHYGYRTHTNQIFKGHCITHEIDVVAEKAAENIHAIVEVKFHSRHGVKTDAKVALYTHARFLDIERAWVAKRKAGAKPERGELQSWLVTNTEVTSEAYKYANCVGMKIISWYLPVKNNLQDLINHKGLYPVTVLLTLSEQEKRILLRNNIVMCKELLHTQKITTLLHLNDKRQQSLIEEVNRICVLNKA